ncbi:DUF2537 domain-containing protein [Skermania sp. ID1734]|uniref:DUF2537 domain-containing protein n=1 Tax=Skermania sp. ID1734 TaxID=2597516 RepID=UPI00117BE8F7|nr:DUF2537 domain-containing protein [Skermania sp. ID1734]TSD96628.1 DUF2537 domain-containing protein [Skermania sp. ID1734]
MTLDSEQPTRRVPEPTPWATGLTVTAIVAALLTVAVFAFGTALARINPILAVVINLVAATGAAPTLWRWRTLPMVRWIVLGVAIGVVLGWFGLVVSAA